MSIWRQGDQYQFVCYCRHEGKLRNSEERAIQDGENHDCVESIKARFPDPFDVKEIEETLDRHTRR